MLKLVEKCAAPYPSFCEFLRERHGRNWCVAPRASGRTARYDVVLTPKRYAAEQTEWASRHPAWLLVQSLPSGAEKAFVLEAVKARLGCG